MNLKKILIVDDEPMLIELAKEALEEDFPGELEIVTCQNGMDAVSLIVNGGQFDLVITDLKMPPGSITGFDVTLGAKKCSPATMTILVSGTLPPDIDKAKEKFRIDVALAKPYDPMELTETAGRLLGLVPQHLQATRS